MTLTILDGPLGTELLARDVPTPLPGWSAHALDEAPDVVSAIHADYAAAGATVHTTNTFRTRRRTFADWERLARKAVELARDVIPPGALLAGSIAPLEDCYRPDLSPADLDPGGTRREHAALASLLAEAGCDLLLCETFPHVAEGLIALECAVATGRPAWIAFTAGPDADLLSPTAMADGAREAVRRGASAVLVNCTPASETGGFLAPLLQAVGADVPIGAYANAGRPDARMGWQSDHAAPVRYAEAVESWVDRGATLVGGCCGTGVAHIRALAERLGDRT